MYLQPITGPLFFVLLRYNIKLNGVRPTSIFCIFLNPVGRVTFSAALERFYKARPFHLFYFTFSHSITVPSYPFFYLKLFTVPSRSFSFETTGTMNARSASTDSAMNPALGVANNIPENLATHETLDTGVLEAVAQLYLRILFPNI